MHIITSNQQISTIGLKLIPNLTMHANKATPNTSTNKRSKPKAETEATMENELNGNRRIPDATTSQYTCILQFNTCPISSHTLNLNHNGIIPKKYVITYHESCTHHIVLIYT